MRNGRIGTFNLPPLALPLALEEPHRADRPRLPLRGCPHAPQGIFRRPGGEKGGDGGDLGAGERWSGEGGLDGVRH